MRQSLLDGLELEIEAACEEARMSNATMEALLPLVAEAHAQASSAFIRAKTLIDTIKACGEVPASSVLVPPINPRIVLFALGCHI